MNEIEKWCAEQCGLKPYEQLLYTANDGERHYATQVIINDFPQSCSLLNANFREIVREKFRFDTEAFSTEGWECYHRDMDKFFSGKTIAEAEIACITAIWESRDGRDE